MKELVNLAWTRMNVISAVVGDMNGRFIAVLFYFTILVPFGIGSTLLSDPLRRKNLTPNNTKWEQREAVPTDMNSAKQQG